MRCDSVLPLLSDFADRSVSPFAALRVRRHLRACTACQTAWADTQTRDQKSRASYEDKIVLPSGLRSRVLSAAPVSVVRPMRRRSWGKIAVVGGCLTVCLVCISLLNRIANAPARSSIAFAQVEAAMQNVKTVHWIEKSRSAFREGEPLGQVRITEKWARLNPPDLVMKHLPSDTPVPPNTYESTSHTLINGHHQINYDPYRNTYTVTNFARWEKEGGDKRTQIIKGWIVSEAISPGAAASYLRATPKNGAAGPRHKKLPSWLPKSSPLKSRIVMEAGRSLILFERTQEPWKMPPSGGGSGLSFGPVTEQTWVEPDTHRVVRHERTQYFPNGREISYQTSSDQFRYNEDLSPSTWVLLPPPGAKVKREEQQFTTSVWETLSKSEKQKIQAAINASDAGWRDGNFAALPPVWDFGYLHSHTPSLDAGPVRRQQWAFRVSHQKNNWAEWHSVINGAAKQNFVVGESFAPNTPDVLRVDVTVTGKPKRGNGQEWSGPATFYLNRTKSGAYTVVEWDWYSLWMKTALPSLRAR